MFTPSIVCKSCPCGCFRSQSVEHPAFSFWMDRMDNAVNFVSCKHRPEVIRLITLNSVIFRPDSFDSRESVYTT